MTEKQWAVVNAALASIFAILFTGIYAHFMWIVPIDFEQDLLDTIVNALLILIPFILSWIPYLFMRGTALNGAILSSLCLLCTLIIFDSRLLLLYIFLVYRFFFLRTLSSLC